MGISKTPLLTLIKDTEVRNGDRRQTESDYVLVYSAKKKGLRLVALLSARIGSPQLDTLRDLSLMGRYCCTRVCFDFMSSRMRYRGNSVGRKRSTLGQGFTASRSYGRN